MFLPYKWSEKEIEILTNLWIKTPIEDIAKVLKGRTKTAIIRKASDLNLHSFRPEIDLEYYAKLLEMKEG